MFFLLWVRENCSSFRAVGVRIYHRRSNTQKKHSKLCFGGFMSCCSVVLFTMELTMEQLQVFNLLSWDISVWWINVISLIILFGRLNTVQSKTHFLTIWTEHLFDVNSHLVIAAYLYYATVMLNSKLEIAYETKPLFKQMFTNFWMSPNCTL